MSAILFTLQYLIRSTLLSLLSMQSKTKSGLPDNNSSASSILNCLTNTSTLQKGTIFSKNDLMLSTFGVPIFYFFYFNLILFFYFFYFFIFLFLFFYFFYFFIFLFFYFFIFFIIFIFLFFHFFCLFFTNIISCCCCMSV